MVEQFVLNDANIPLSCLCSCFVRRVSRRNSGAPLMRARDNSKLMRPKFDIFGMWLR